MKPSVRRRRQRRKENRDNTRNSSSLDLPNTLSTISTPTFTQSTTVDDQNSNLLVTESIVPQQKPLQDVSRIIDSTPNYCQIDVAVQAVNTARESACQTEPAKTNCTTDLFTLDYSRRYQEDASRPYHRLPSVRVRQYTDDEMKNLLRKYGMMTPAVLLNKPPF